MKTKQTPQRQRHGNNGRYWGRDQVAKEEPGGWQLPAHVARALAFSQI